MRAQRSFGLVAVVFTTAGSLVTACSAAGVDPDSGGDQTPTGGKSAAGGTSSTAGTSQNGGSGGSLGVGAGGSLMVGPGMCGGDHCSSDLHSYVDCSGNVLMMCPPDQGCVAGGSCESACDSAKTAQTSFGCEYYALDPDVAAGVNGGCYAAFVVNSWDADVSLTVDYGGMPLDPSTFGYLPTGTGASSSFMPLPNGTIPAGQVAILFLNKFGASLGVDTSCPKGITPAITTMDTAPHGTTMGKSFHITTSAPTIAYDIYPFGGGRSALTSATLLLPTSAWGDNYIAVSPFGMGAFGAAPVLSIVGQADATSVTINPVANIKGGSGIPGTPANTPATYMVNAGQVLQFAQAATLEGSVIQSTAPIGVWAGMQVLAIESCCDDSAHQQIPPIRAWGSEYVGVRYRNRYDGMEESPPWRFVGAVDGTVLTWEPSAPSGAPTMLDQGTVAQFDNNGPWVVRSQDAQHPFYISAHMTGAGLFDPSYINMNDPNAAMDGRGDAEFVNVVPPGEFLDDYVFYSDPTYPETNLVVIRVIGPGGFADVNLDCAGALTDWQPVGTSGEYEYTRIDLSRHDFQPQGNCDNGRHEISSTNPFGLTVWGWGSGETGQMGAGFYSQYVSYAYPAGAGAAPINTVVVLPNPH